MAAEFVVYVTEGHWNCCDHRVQVLAATGGPLGYDIPYIHYTGHGDSDAVASPFDLVAIGRHPDAPDAARLHEVETPDVWQFEGAV